MSTKITQLNSSGGLQRSQVGKHVLEDGIRHPTEVPWIEVDLEARGLDSSYHGSRSLT